MNDFMQEDNEKKGVFNKIKASFTGRKFRSGAYVSLMTAVVIVLVLVLNLIVTKMDLKVDLSTQKMYTLTEPSVELVKNMKDDVTIYYLVESGSEKTILQKIASKYDSLSDHIKLEYKDPVLYPKFASKYVSDEINPNSFLVVNNNNGRAKYVDYNSMIIEQVDYNTFQSNVTGIDVEGKLTSAIQYVTTQNVPVLYATTGHSENEVGELFKTTLEKQNVKVNSLATLTTESIPEDCNILYINEPKSDFSEGEITLIKNYMAAGGNVVLVIDYLAEDFANLKTLLEYNGVGMEDGIICEGDGNKHVPQYPHYIVPNILNHDITNAVTSSKKFVIMPVSSGLSILDSKRSSLTVTPLFQTSDQAYAKVSDSATTYEKEVGDIDGPFYTGVLASDSFKGVTSNLVVYSSGYVFDDSSFDYGNYELLTGTMNYLAGGAAPVTVKSRSLIPEAVQFTEKEAALWGALVTIVLPLAILATGLLVILRRRKR